jgi:hypothetical protein
MRSFGTSVLTKATTVRYDLGSYIPEDGTLHHYLSEISNPTLVLLFVFVYSKQRIS